ncbi:MAG: hypothetical protein AB1Z98_35830 [Nannocystaceae bacterium]
MSMEPEAANAVPETAAAPSPEPEAALPAEAPPGTAEVAPAGTDAAAPAGTDGPELPDTSSLWTDGPSWLPGVSWGVLIIAAVVLVAVVVAVVLLVRWQRKRRAAGPKSAGPSIDRRLRSIWEPFYRRLPRRAQHYPSFIVVGEAGAGKSHLIGSRVDWRGQANQFNPSAYQSPLMQLYLGDDVVVHELSSPLLRDVSRGAKRALTRLWRNVGPSATMVVVVDARTLATTPDADLRALAQLVRGKIGLLPRRVGESIDVRVGLTFLDEVDGYDEFAAVMGTHQRGLPLDRLGPDYADADALLSSFDGHLAYALTTRSGEEFGRLVRFYDSLRGLTSRLPALLTGLRGEATDTVLYPPSQLYLASILPHSYVGDPFQADPGLVVSSIEGHNRRTTIGALVLGGVGMVAVGSLSLWHMRRVDDAEEAVDEHEREQDGLRGSSSAERRTAEAAANAIHRMDESGMVWLRWSHVQRKQEIARHFEHTIREGYLLPWLSEEAAGEDGADRVTLLYVVSLIYGTRGGDLGRHIQRNARWWASSLGLTEQIITYYIESSTVAYDVELPQDIDDRTGREWIEYSELLCSTLGRTEGIVSDGELLGLQQQPSLRTKSEYEALEQARQLLLEDHSLALRLAPILGDLDAALASDDHRGLVEVSAAIDELTEPATQPEPGWGLGTLMTELERVDQWRERHLEPSEVIDRSCGSEPGTAAAAMARTRASALVEEVLEAIPDHRIRSGLSFFDEDEHPLDVGSVRGYGGGSTVTIAGYYTKDAFEDHVEPVLQHAAVELPEYELETKDRERVQRYVKNAVAAYASAYRDELMTYYLGFEFDPGSKVALPFALKGLVQPSSWFTDFLTTVTSNASLTLVDDEYHAPLISALDTFTPLVTLLAEKDGAIPGLEPYAAIISGLLPLMDASTVPAPAPRARRRPSLQTLQGVEVDRRAQVTEWLEGARIDYSWHRPFDAPLEQVYRYGEQDLEDEIEQAWVDDVRPVVRPLLATYPFDATAEVDARVADLESVLRRQGEPGQLWTRFDLLIAPATRPGTERITMLGSIPAPLGMLEMLEDVQELSSTLWDTDGKRRPLMLQVTPQALPTAPEQGRVASMAYLAAGGSAVYAFNQRPEPQTLQLRWWEQGDAIVSLTMTNPDDEDDAKEHTLEEQGTTFSLYHLLDLGRSCKGRDCRKKPGDERTLTQVAIEKGTQCGRYASRGTEGLSVAWGVPIDDLGKKHRRVRVTLDSDPWAPFAVRDCR